MEAATYPTLLRLRLPSAGTNRDDSNALWKLPRVLELSSSLGRLTTVDGRHVSGGATVRGRRGPLAVLAAVSVAAVLTAGLAAVHGSAPAVGESRMSPAASDGCPPGNRLGTVAATVDVPEVVQVAVQVAVQVVVQVAMQLAVFTAVQVGVDMDRSCPSIFKGDSGYPKLSWLLTTVRNPRTRAEERYNEAHGQTRRVIERTFGLLRARFRCLNLTGGSLYYSPKKVCQIIVACCMLHNLALRRQVPFLQEDGSDGGLVAAVEPVDSEEEEAEEEDIDNRNNIIIQYFQ
ncbi:hypothetical protein NDU88_004758 [Pleurodeles waltl]|uniref:DDE Tnp4 domain-containing protein n=1 Tax=Pleurodeles waltl TaxID=8319 RepID=A0AAV7WXL0_PLEWA|nr:hypothetical protein NDU88_004758 [Pleurodeles waltl]